MASSVRRLLTLEDETWVRIARAGALVNDPLKRKIPTFSAAWPRRGLGLMASRPRHQQDDEAADEGAAAGGADSDP